jgi:hypothetical protein
MSSSFLWVACVETTGALAHAAVDAARERSFPRVYACGVDDRSVLARIEALVAEEHALLGRERADATSEQALAGDRERLDALSVELDRCWDLLRQRRALRDAGGNPEDARARDGDTVEHYLQ